MDRGAFECLDFVYYWAAEGYTVKWVVGEKGTGQADAFKGWSPLLRALLP